jgi:hypothetical protein
VLNKVVVDLYSGKKTATASAASDNDGVPAATYTTSPGLVGATAKLWVSNADEDLAIKDAINEGGALYTLKIASLSALFQ